MRVIKGRYNEAVIYTNNIEQTAIKDIKAVCDLEFLKDSRIRIMPDVHAGSGCTIGTTMTIADKIVPGFVGVDIGCGMEVVKFAEKDIDCATLDDYIRGNIPAGFAIRSQPHAYNLQIDLQQLKCANYANIERATLSIGTLGGGNHFIEVDRDNEGYLYLVIHSGSRNLGQNVAKHYQDIAYRKLNISDGNSVKKLIAEYKEAGREKELEEAIKKIKALERPDFAKDYCYVEGCDLDNYLHDMDIAQKYATLNRKAIADEIVRGMKLTITEQFTTIHNYIEIENMMLRKGAVSAKKGEKLIIPINMRDGSLICIGKGNSEWNYSAPHGAGRILGRNEAHRLLNMEDFEKSMRGIYTTSVCRSTLDESPQAYKPMDEIISNISGTAKIANIIRPIYNFKATD